MSKPVAFPGVNMFFASPPSRPDIPGISVFTNDICMVSCWELTDAEIEEIVLRKRVYLTQLSGKVFYPTMIAGAAETRSIAADYGAVLPPLFKEKMQ